MTFWDYIFGARKAIWSAFGSFLLVLSTALATMPAGTSIFDINSQGWIGILLAFFLATGGTYYVTNKPRPVAPVKEESELERAVADLLKTTQDKAGK